MSVNNEYKRYFIILQEDEKGFEFSPGKMPTGYVKIEVKNGKGKLTAFVQNVRSDERSDYRLLLVAPNKRMAVEIGRAMIDSSGRGEIYHEFESDNVLGSGLNISEYIVAAVSTGSGIPLSGYVGRDKLDWKNKYEVINKPKDVRKDKKSQPVEEIPVPMQSKPMVTNMAPMEEVLTPPVQPPVTVAAPMEMPQKAKLPIEEIPMVEQPKPQKAKLPIEEIPKVEHPKPKKEKLQIEEIPIKIEKPIHKKEVVPIQEIPMEVIPIVEEKPAPPPPPPPQLNIQPKFELNLEPIIEITHEDIMLNQINIEQIEETMPVEEKEECVVPCPPIPCEYDYYYCEEESEECEERPKHHEHHDHHEHHEDHHEHEQHDEDYEGCEEYYKLCEDDHDHDEYDYNPYYCSNMYKHLRNMLKRLRKCEPFEEEDRGCEWFMVQNEIYMLNDVAVPYMGKMMPLGYPFMMEDYMSMGRKDYLFGVCYDREHEHDDRKHIKHVMFGIPGMYSKTNEHYYMAKGFTRFRKHRERAYGYWIMCLDIRNGMLKR